MTSNQRSATYGLLRLRFSDWQGQERIVYADRAVNRSPGGDASTVDVGNGLHYPAKELVEIVPLIVTEVIRDAEA